MSDDVMIDDEARYWQGLAMALVVLHHADDDATFRTMVTDMTDREAGAMVAILAGWVDEAWTVLTERDGLTFESFTADAGLWLAGGEV